MVRFSGCLRSVKFSDFPLGFLHLQWKKNPKKIQYDPQRATCLANLSFCFCFIYSWMVPVIFGLTLSVYTSFWLSGNKSQRVCGFNFKHWNGFLASVQCKRCQEGLYVSIDMLFILMWQLFKLTDMKSSGLQQKVMKWTSAKLLYWHRDRPLTQPTLCHIQVRGKIMRFEK